MYCEYVVAKEGNEIKSGVAVGRFLQVVKELLK